jgi:hypothetical protein
VGHIGVCKCTVLRLEPQDFEAYRTRRRAIVGHVKFFVISGRAPVDVIQGRGPTRVR